MTYALSGLRFAPEVEAAYPSLRPSAPGEAKFMILRPPVRDPSVLATWMHVFPRAAMVRARIEEYIALANGGADSEWRWFVDSRLAYPLFKVPALYRARHDQPHPLLEVFA
ncbi:MAG: hypothetical protein HC902_01685 [Calothrix sp. SM1_5_4]|nr:hypothetical protein [Calothrix sp. SM1_5_4]